MTIPLTEMASDDLSQLAIDLDPQDREQKKAQRAYRLNVMQIPLLRLFGFGLVLLGVLLHNLFLSHSFSWPSFVHLILIVVTYTLLSWLLLYLLYTRIKLFDVGVFFLVADVFVWTVAVYFAGGEKSWFFFILMMRVADQVNTSFKRALSFAHLPVLSYGLMLLYISVVEQRWISWPAEVTKMLYIYGANLYIALAARPAEQRRNRITAAMRVARELLLRLTEKSQHLEEAKIGLETLNHQNEVILRAELTLSQAKEAAEAATWTKSEFLATMSHELRTPLSVILGYSELIAEGEFGPLTNEQGETLKRIRRNALELHELITSVLDLSRLEAGRLPVNVTEVRVPALLEELQAEIQEAYQHLQLHFRWEVEAELAPIYTDSQKLKVVLRNLIGNAVKFTPQGSITVKASPKSEGVEMSVTDTGIGISPEALAVIFEPFRQVNGTVARQYGGAGLGLHIVKRLLELLDGTVTVESQVGRGSTFMVWVPINSNSPTP